MATVICPKCGLKVRAEDGECFACGSRLPRVAKEPRYEEPVFDSNVDANESGQSTGDLLNNSGNNVSASVA